MPSHSSASSPRDVIKVAIIGAGPHALAAASALLSYDKSPDGFTDKDLVHMQRTAGRLGLNALPSVVSKEDILVFDPSGQWLHAWDTGFNVLNIKYLRSPLMDHGDSSDQDALAQHAQQLGWEQHTTAINKGLRTRRRKNRDAGPEEHFVVRCPSSHCFQSFCQSLINHLGIERRVRAAAIADVQWKAEEHVFQLTTSDGACLHASHVIYAGGSHCPRIPAPFQDHVQHVTAHANSACPVVMHSEQLLSSPDTWESLVSCTQEPHTVAIIGGGLTAAHLAINLAAQHTGTEQNTGRSARRGTPSQRRHARRCQREPTRARSEIRGDGGKPKRRVVHLIVRGSLQTRPFDLDARWFSRFSSQRELFDYLRQDAPTRREHLRVLQRGSIPHQIAQHLYRLQAAGRLVIHEQAVALGCNVLSSSPQCSPACALSLSDGCDLRVDHVVLCTGTETSVAAAPCLQNMLREGHTRILDGLPDVEANLRWAPDIPLYLMGPLSALQVGPFARNLRGGRRAASIIAEDIIEKLVESGEETQQSSEGVPSQEHGPQRSTSPTSAAAVTGETELYSQLLANPFCLLDTDCC